MKSGIPWSLKRVDEDTRQAVIDAAKRSGMSVGDWLNQALTQRTRSAPAARGLSPRHASPDALTESLRHIKQELGALERRLREPPGAPPRRSVQDIVSELAREIESPDERARSQIEGIAARTDSQAFRPPSDKVADAVRDLERRIADMGVHAATASTPAPDSGQFDDIRRHLDGLLARSERPVPAIAPPTRHDEPHPSLTPEAPDLADPMAQLEAQLAEISSRLRDAHAEPRSTPRVELASAVREISAHQRAIDAEAEVPPVVTPQARQLPSSDAIAALRSDIAGLTSQVNSIARLSAEERTTIFDLTRRMDALAAEGPAGRALLADIRAELEAVRSSIGGESTAAALAELSERQDDLTRHLAALLSGSPNRRQIEALTNEVAGLRQTVEAGDAAHAAERIDVRLADLGHTIDMVLANQQAEASPNPVLEQIDDRLRDIAHRIDSLGHADDQMAVMTEIGRRLEERLEAAVDHVATLLASLPDPTEAIEDIRARVATLAARVDALSGTQAGHDGAAAEAVLAEIHALKAEVAERTAARADVDELETQVRDLATQLAAVAALVPEHETLSDIEAQVSRMVADLDAAKPRTATLDHIETVLTRLEEGLAEATRQSVTGARAEAQQAVTQLSEVVAQYEIDADLVRSLMRDLDAVKAATGVGDTGTLARVESVSRTLGDVIDRLARLEQAAADPAAGNDTKPAAAEPSTPEARIAERRADFVGAARRAAKAAAARVAANEYSPNYVAPPPVAAAQADLPAVQPAEERKPGAFARISEAIRTRRKPLLLAAAVLVLTIGAIEAFGRLTAPVKDETSLTINADTTEDTAVAPAPVVSPAPPAPAVAAPAAPEPHQFAEETLVAPASPDAAIAFAEPAGPVERFEAGGAPPTEEPQFFQAAATALQPTTTRLSLDPRIGPANLITAAEDGDPAAAFEVARRYAEGSAVPKDLGRAVSWYRRAAEGGVAVAQYRLASLYERGQGVERNLVDAVNWYQRAADQGNVNAMHNLAVMMSEGIDGTPDHDKALQWFLAAANYGVRDSQYNLGVIYARGLGLPQDLVESYKWFAIAAREGDTDALARRDEVASAMTPQEMERGRSAVAEWQARPTIAEANGVATPPGGWDSGTIGIAQADRDELVLKIQILLAEQGYDPGPADGVIGPKTVDAVRAFQRKTGQPETGRIDEMLVASLGG